MTPERRTELIQKTITHFEKQGKRGEVGGSCAYRTKDGATCAVGCHIIPEAYSNQFEGTSLFSASGNPEHGLLLKALKRSGIDTEDPEEVRLLCDLQKIHDSGFSFATTLENLRGVSA